MRAGSGVAPVVWTRISGADRRGGHKRANTAMLQFAMVPGQGAKAAVCAVPHTKRVVSAWRGSHAQGAGEPYGLNARGDRLATATLPIKRE